jgi:hypothetical protein
MIGNKNYSKYLPSRFVFFLGLKDSKFAVILPEISALAVLCYGG